MPGLTFDDLPDEQNPGAVRFDDLPDDDGFFSRVGRDVDKRSQMIAEIKAATDRGEQSKFEEQLQLLGKGGAGIINDIAGEALVSGFRALPDAIENPIRSGAKSVGNYLGDTMVGRGAANAARWAGDKYQDLSKEYPRAARNVEAVANIGSLLAGQRIAASAGVDDAAAAGAKGVKNAVKKGADFYKKNIATHAPNVTSENIRKIGGQILDRAAKSGAVIKPAAATTFLDDIAEAVAPKGVWEGAATLKSEVDDIVKNLSELRGQAMSLDDAMRLDSRLGKLAYSPKNYAMGKFTPEGAQILKIKESLENMIDKAAEAGYVAGDDTAIAAWNEGKKYWGTSIRARDIENIIENAQFTDHPATSIRVGMRNLVKNKNKFSKFTPEQQFLIKKAAKTGIVTDAYRAAGSLLGPIVSGSVGATVGGLVGGPVGAAIGGAAAAGPSFAIREGAKAAATARQTAKALQAYQAVIRDAIGVPKNLTLKQIMKLPPEQAKLYLSKITPQ